MRQIIRQEQTDHTPSKWRGKSRRPEHMAKPPARDLLVWIWCRYPVVAAGLEQVIREEFRVHCGQEPPGEETPSFVVFFAEDAESLLKNVGRARKPNPDALIVVFGPEGDPLFVRAALRAGARGYIHAAYTPEQIIRALKVVANGEVAAPRQLLGYLIEEMTGKGTVDIAELSDRQSEVLKLVADGLSNAQIGERLFLSESTVKQHLRSVYKLLGVKNRTEAARLARNGGIAANIAG